MESVVEFVAFEREEEERREQRDGLRSNCVIFVGAWLAPVPLSSSPQLQEYGNCAKTMKLAGKRRGKLIRVIRRLRCDYH